jgi:hypothetical protein
MVGSSGNELRIKCGMLDKLSDSYSVKNGCVSWS